MACESPCKLACPVVGVAFGYSSTSSAAYTRQGDIFSGCSRYFELIEKALGACGSLYEMAISIVAIELATRGPRERIYLALRSQQAYIFGLLLKQKE